MNLKAVKKVSQKLFQLLANNGTPLYQQTTDHGPIANLQCTISPFYCFFICSTFDMDQQSATKWVETIRPKHSENKIFMYYVRIDAHWTFHYTLYSFTSCVRRLSLNCPLIDLKESVQVFRR